MFCPDSCSGGFSMLELVVIVLITSVLVVAAVPRIFSNDDAKLATAARMVCSDIATVQNMAVACGATMEMTFTASSYSVRNVTADSEVKCGGRFPVTDISSDLGTSISTSGIIVFNSLGEPSQDSLGGITLYLVSDTGRTKEITIERETGHVRTQ